MENIAVELWHLFYVGAGLLLKHIGDVGWKHTEIKKAYALVMETQKSVLNILPGLILLNSKNPSMKELTKWKPQTTKDMVV